MKLRLLLLMAAALLWLGAQKTPATADETPAVSCPETPAVVNAAITDYGAIMDGRHNRQRLSVRPFLDDWSGFVAVQNTGTTFIDHFTVSFSCPMKDSDAISIKLLSPAIPALLWKPFARDMLSLCTRDMIFTINDGRVTMRDGATGLPITITGLTPSSPLTPAGLAPGETILVEYTEPYSSCMEGFVRSIAERKNMDVRIDIADRENSVIRMTIKEYKVALITFEQIVAAIRFKGKGEYGLSSLVLTIDGQLCHSVPWVEFEWQ